MSDPFLGEIRMVGFNFAPSGWAFCQGQTISVAQNNALFALLGTSYGGNGSSNFMLPNLAGRSPVGIGNGANLKPIAVADIGGQENFTLTNNELPSHTHTATASGGGTVSTSVAIPATTTAGGQELPATNTVLGPVTASGRAGGLYSTATANTTLTPFNVTGTVAVAAPAIGTAGLGNPMPLRNPYLGINFVIALEGIYPSRS